MRNGSGNLICGLLFILTGALCIIADLIVHWDVGALARLCGVIIIAFGIFVSYRALMYMRTENDPVPADDGEHRASEGWEFRKKDYRVFDKEDLSSLMSAVFLLLVLPFVLISMCFGNDRFSLALVFMFFSIVDMVYYHKEKRRTFVPKTRIKCTYKVKGAWKCPHCENINSGESRSCGMCGYERPSDKGY